MEVPNEAMILFFVIQTVALLSDGCHGIHPCFGPHQYQVLSAVSFLPGTNQAYDILDDVQQLAEFAMLDRFMYEVLLQSRRP